jgi:iron-sulfur cluster assembly protein
MLTLTDKAQGKVKEILDSQPEPFAGLRVQVVGGGCSGFQYHMGFEKQENSGDEILDLGGFKVFVDRGSSMYLDGTCGCGESFQA